MVTFESGGPFIRSSQGGQNHWAGSVVVSDSFAFRTADCGGAHVSSSSNLCFL